MKQRKKQVGARYVAKVRGAFWRVPRPVTKPSWQTAAKADYACTSGSFRRGIF